MNGKVANGPYFVWSVDGPIYKNLKGQGFVYEMDARIFAHTQGPGNYIICGPHPKIPGQVANLCAIQIPDLVLDETGSSVEVPKDLLGESEPVVLPFEQPNRIRKYFG